MSGQSTRLLQPDFELARQNPNFCPPERDQGSTEISILGLIAGKVGHMNLKKRFNQDLMATNPPYQRSGLG